MWKPFAETGSQRKIILLALKKNSPELYEEYDIDSLTKRHERISNRIFEITIGNRALNVDFDPEGAVHIGGVIDFYFSKTGLDYEINFLSIMTPCLSSLSADSLAVICHRWLISRDSEGEVNQLVLQFSELIGTN